MKRFVNLYGRDRGSSQHIESEETNDVWGAHEELLEKVAEIIVRERLEVEKANGGYVGVTPFSYTWGDSFIKLALEKYNGTK